MVYSNEYQNNVKLHITQNNYWSCTHDNCCMEMISLQGKNIKTKIMCVVELLGSDFKEGKISGFFILGDNILL